MAGQPDKSHLAKQPGRKPDEARLERERIEKQETVICSQREENRMIAKTETGVKKGPSRPPNPPFLKKVYMLKGMVQQTGKKE